VEENCLERILIEKLIKVIEQETGTANISLSTRLDLLVEDSLEFLSLVAAIENAFNFKIPDEKYVEVQTVADLLSFTTNHVSN